MLIRKFTPLLALTLLFSSCSFKSNPTPVDPVDDHISPAEISINYASLELMPGAVQQLTVTYNPENADINRELVWGSNNPNAASVNGSGRVVIKPTASIGDTAIIYARLKNISSILATCEITVVSRPIAEYTLLIYMSGGNLENYFANKTEVKWSQEDPNRPWNGCGFATRSIQEILSVPNKPDDVNIVIQTGGATRWANSSNGQYGSYNIDGTYIQRHHVGNDGKLHLDMTLPTSSMGDALTLQPFIEYGLNYYPAQRTALILWGEGIGILGVCSDQYYSERFELVDTLLVSEIFTGVHNALNNTGHSGEKLEFIGYDCGMLVLQDYTEYLSSLFKYMIGCQEEYSSWGAGWAYAKWIDDLYAKKSTEEILKVICDETIDKHNYDSYGNLAPANNNQAIAYFDLSKAEAFKGAWEYMAQQMLSELGEPTETSIQAFFNHMQTIKHFGGDYYYLYGEFDVKDFINKIDESVSYKAALLAAYNDLVVYSIKGQSAGNANGLSLFWPINTYTYKFPYYINDPTYSHYSYWKQLADKFGGRGTGY